MDTLDSRFALSLWVPSAVSPLVVCPPLSFSPALLYHSVSLLLIGNVPQLGSLSDSLSFSLSLTVSALQFAVEPFLKKHGHVETGNYGHSAHIHGPETCRHALAHVSISHSHRHSHEYNTCLPSCVEVCTHTLSQTLTHTHQVVCRGMPSEQPAACLFPSLPPNTHKHVLSLKHELKREKNILFASHLTETHTETHAETQKTHTISSLSF